MKKVSLLFCMVLINTIFAMADQPAYIKIGGTLDTSGEFPVMVGGTNYTHGQTVELECGITTLTVSIPLLYGPNGLVDAAWAKSSNFSLTEIGVSPIQSLQLDVNRDLGFISAAYVSGGIGGTPITIYIKQKPNAPSITSLSSSCISVNQTGSASASVTYSFQGTKPLNLVWTGSNGVTVNGGSTYTQTGTTSGTVNFQNTSYGQLSVYAVIPGCNNAQTAPVSTYIGPPFISDVTVNNVLNPGPVGVSAYSTSYVSTASAYGYVPSYSFSTYNLSGNLSLSVSGINGGNCQVYASGTIGSAALQITASNSCGNNVRTVVFYIPYSYRIISNPAKEKLTITFAGTEVEEALPDRIELISEKEMKEVKSVSIKEMLKNKAFNNGNEVTFDVKSLPRGIYYVRVINPRQEKDKQVEMTRVLFE